VVELSGAAAPADHGMPAATIVVVDRKIAPAALARYRARAV